jgi:CheY-like chemotaxis protein
MVDDEDVVRTTVCELLRASGMDCTEASSSHEAMAVLSEEAFNVALIDLQMPDVDGYELARNLRGSPAHCSMRLLAMSAYDISEDGKALFDAFVPKPASLATLEKAIAAAMRRGGPGSEGHEAKERPDRFASTNSK